MGLTFAFSLLIILVWNQMFVNGGFLEGSSIMLLGLERP
jgi:hypothetical protein